jgi:hypothetical protein
MDLPAVAGYMGELAVAEKSTYKHIIYFTFKQSQFKPLFEIFVHHVANHW